MKKVFLDTNVVIDLLDKRSLLPPTQTWQNRNASVIGQFA